MAHVYFLKKEDEIVYVGKSVNDPMIRIRAHQREKIKKFDSFSFLETDIHKNSEIEKVLIGHYKPLYNNPIDCYPELNLILLKRIIRDKNKRSEAIKYIKRNNIDYFKFNNYYYVSKDKIDEIKGEVGGQYYFKPLDIKIEISDKLNDVLKIEDNKNYL